MCNAKYDIIEIIESYKPGFKNVSYQEAMYEKLDDIGTEICKKLNICECCGHKLNKVGDNNG